MYNVYIFIKTLNRKENGNVKPAFLESYELLNQALNDWMVGANLISEWSIFHASAPRKANDFWP